MNTYIFDYIAGALGFVSIFLGVLVWFRSYTDKRLKIIYVLFATGMGLWMITVALADLSSSLSNLVFWTKAATIASTIGVGSFVIFAYLFRRPESNIKKLLLWYLPIILVIFYILQFPQKQVYLSDPFANHNPNEPIGGILSDSYALYIPLLFGYIIWTTIILLRKKSSLNNKTKNQIYYITAGSVITMLAGITFDAVLPVFGIDFLYSLGPTFAITLVGGTAYAIIKHELMDIRIIIQRGLIYSALLVLIIAAYLLFIFFVGSILNRITNTAILFSGAITTIIAIFGVPPLEKYFRKVTDRWFFKEPYDYAIALHELSQILNDNLELNLLKNQISDTLNKILKNKFSYLTLINETTTNKGELIPIKFKNQTIAHFNLGAKLSGDNYTPTDYKLLETFANQAAVALEKARLFEEVKLYSEELEKRVEDRTSQLKNLQETQKHIMLEIAHNLQTPLTILKNRFEFLKKVDTNNENWQSLEKSISDISQFIYDLLSWAKLKQTSELTKEKINLSQLLIDLVEYFETVAQSHGIKISTDIAPNLYIYGDQKQIEQLITNVVSNSIKYISGNRLIKIQLKNKNLMAQLSIEDTGIGIPQEDLSRLFVPFFRSQNQSTSNIKGTGLGLAIAKKIIDLHQGQIAAESILGKGTIFTINLPLK